MILSGKLNLEQMQDFKTAYPLNSLYLPIFLIVRLCYQKLTLKSPGN